MAMVPPPLSETQSVPQQIEEEPVEAIPVLGAAVRGTLLWLAAGLVAMFAIALWLDPYERDEEGKVLRARVNETHTQMGLPPCTFKRTTGIPCPSCGMTTSFALLIHGDPIHSAEANVVGTLLAIFLLCLIPWCLVCSLFGRPFIVRTIEGALARTVVVFLFLMLTRWGIYVGVTLLNR